MKLLPITLTAHKGNWQRFKARTRNKRFLAIQKKIFARDNNTCRFCGFKIDKFQHVVNIDHNYTNNKASNMVTSCSLCAQCFFLDSIGKDGTSGGNIIYLPEISQADLNHFCRILFASMLRETPYLGKLQSSYLSFLDRSEIVDELFGPESHKANTFGQALIDSNLDKKDQKKPILNNLRLLADRKHFTKEINYWKTNVFEQLPL